MKKLILLVCILAGMFNLSFAQTSPAANISCRQSFELIQQHQYDTTFVILDLRTIKMYNEGHLQNAVCYDVFSETFDNWLNTLNKEKTYLLYCNVGHRSGIALDKMKEKGFKKLYHMYEGIQGWKNQGYEVIAKRD